MDGFGWPGQEAVEIIPEREKSAIWGRGGSNWGKRQAWNRLRIRRVGDNLD